ncbi:UNVERIFIED_CONTAM: hypothetical protein Sradi_0706900 [Sesamum radiatum]|uniref:Uncharacterized protein n=1 Tax=Sesamum radiatum TaxID=300843 RepID=A0AAW2VM17_SESRA
MFNSTLTKSEDLLCPVDGSIMIRASRLPYNRNGFKLFTDAGGLGKVVKDILERAPDIYKNFTDEGLREAERKATQSVERVDDMTVYTSDLVAAVRKAAGNSSLCSKEFFLILTIFQISDRPLDGFHIVFDAGNGAGGLFADAVSRGLGGAGVDVIQYGE